jgi:hypothetical protein
VITPYSPKYSVRRLVNDGPREEAQIHAELDGAVNQLFATICAYINEGKDDRLVKTALARWLSAHPNLWAAVQQERENRH